MRKCAMSCRRSSARIARCVVRGARMDAGSNPKSKVCVCVCVCKCVRVCVVMNCLMPPETSIREMQRLWVLYSGLASHALLLRRRRRRRRRRLQCNACFIQVIAAAAALLQLWCSIPPQHTNVMGHVCSLHPELDLEGLRRRSRRITRHRTRSHRPVTLNPKPCA